MQTLETNGDLLFFALVKYPDFALNWYSFHAVITAPTIRAGAEEFDYFSL
jgi:hypothetical protein